MLIRPRGCRSSAGGSWYRPCLGVQPPGARPPSNCTRFMPDQRASPVDSLSVHPHCALRCLPLGACVGASESRFPPPRRVPLTGQPARATGMISSWAPTRRRSTTQSRQPGTRCARVCSPSTVEGLGNVSVELGAAAGTSGPCEPHPRRQPQRPEHPPHPPA